VKRGEKQTVGHSIFNEMARTLFIDIPLYIYAEWYSIRSLSIGGRYLVLKV
jgi:hypothetical protein